MIRNSGAVKLPALLISIGLLAACGQQAPQPKPVQDEIDEVHALVQAVKDNPSVKDPNQAGAPIHVDPYPKSAGATHGPKMSMNQITH